MVDITMSFTPRPPSSDEPGIVVRVAGTIDRSGARKLRTVLDTVVTAPGPLTVNLTDATATDSKLLHALCTFHRERHHLDLSVRLIGLHAGNMPDPTCLTLAELFVVYEQTRSASTTPAGPSSRSGPAGVSGRSVPARR